MNGGAGGADGGADTRHIVNQGDTVVLRDNRNESSNDSNPYAYPYYHHPSSSEDGPHIYDMVVRLGGKWLAHDFEGEEELEVYVAQLLERLDQSHPRQILWKDSCGDTALHRLCQSARFLDVSVLSELQLGSSSMVAVAKAIVECNPKAAVALNNWKETPLHQFVAHCAFPAQPPNDALRSLHNDADVRTRLQMVRNPWIGLLKCLCSNKFGEASVDALAATHCANHWGALPLHDACTLSGVVVDRDEYRGGRHNPLYQWYHEQHFQMIRLLCQRAGSPDHLIRKDQQGGGLTPLHRAFDSKDCEVQVFEHLLEESLNCLYGISTLLEQLFHRAFTSGKLAHFQNRRRTNSENKFEPLWSKFLLLVPKHHEAVLAEQQHYPNRTRDDTWSFLHKFVHLWCKSTSSSCSRKKTLPQEQQPHILQFVVDAHPEQLLQQDSAGRTPLMVFLLENEQQEKSPSLLEEQVKILVDSSSASFSNPHGVLSMPLRDCGRYPLHVAISQGSSWYGCCSFMARQDCRIATLRDPVTGLYPFQLAAAATSTPPTAAMNDSRRSYHRSIRGSDYDEEEDNTDDDDTRRLGLIFELLREAPVACAPRSTD